MGAFRRSLDVNHSRPLVPETELSLPTPHAEARVNGAAIMGASWFCSETHHSRCFVPNRTLAFHPPRQRMVEWSSHHGRTSLAADHSRSSALGTEVSLPYLRAVVRPFGAAIIGARWTSFDADHVRLLVLGTEPSLPTRPAEPRPCEAAIMGACCISPDHSKFFVLETELSLPTLHAKARLNGAAITAPCCLYADHSRSFVLDTELSLPTRRPEVWLNGAAIIGACCTSADHSRFSVP